MAALDASFAALVDDIRSARQSVTQNVNVFDEAAWDQRLRYIAPRTDEIRDLYRQRTPTERAEFVQRHCCDLYNVYDATLGSFAEMYMPAQIPKHRAFMDRFFNGLDIRRPATYFDGFPSRIFNEFVKGITHFNGDESHDHSEMTWIQKIRINPSDTPRTVRRKKDALKKCYIERLIFDEIYTHLLHKQNTGHLIELRFLERYFQDTNSESIHVDVTFDQTYYPIAVDVVIVNAVDGVRTTEHYAKYWGDPTVHCERIVVRPRVIRRYRKQQTFQSEARWTLIQ